MNTEQLLYFELAYKERSFSAAARRVPVSPQGLTKAIHALERELEVPLFAIDDESGLPVPTEYAHELYEFAAVYDSNTRLLKEAFERIRGREEREVRLGCALGVAGLMGQEFIKKFSAVHPHIRVSYWESNDALCDSALRDGTCDLALTTVPIDPCCSSAPLYRCQWYLWVPADDLLAERDTLGVEDLADRPIAMPGSGYKCFDQLHELARLHGVRLGPIFEISELFQTYEFAATGRGLGFTIEPLVDLSVFRGSMVKALPLSGLSWGFDVERLMTHALGDAEQALWDWCVSYSHDLPCNALDA